VSFDRDGEFIDWSNTPWYTYVEGKARQREDSAALKTGEPSIDVVNEIQAASDYMKGKDRLQMVRNRAIGVLGFLIVVIIGAAVVAGIMSGRAKAATKEAQDANASAVQAKQAADTATREAEKSLSQAIAAQIEAGLAQLGAEIAKANAAEQKRLANEATIKLHTANKLTEIAKRDLKTAQANLTEANKAKDKADADAKEQAGIAAEQKKAADAAGREKVQALRSSFDVNASRIQSSLADLGALRNAVTDSIQTLTRWDSDGSVFADSLHVALTDAAISMKKNGLSLGIGDFPEVTDFDVSLTGGLLLTTGYRRPEDKRQELPTANLWDLRSRQPFWELKDKDLKPTACAMSPDSHTFAIGFESGLVKILTVNGMKVRELRSRSLPLLIKSLKFTADGKQLVLVNGEDWNGRNMFLVDVETATPHALSLPDKLRKLELGNAYWYFRGFIQAGVFPNLQQAPGVIGIFDFESHLTTVDTSTGQLRQFDLGTPRHAKLIGDVDTWHASVLSSNGRWLLGIPSTPKLATTPLLVDLQCLGHQEQRCKAVYPLEAIHYLTEAQIAFDPTGKFLLVGKTERQLRIYNLEMLETNASMVPRELELPASFTIKSFSNDGPQVSLLIESTQDSCPGELRVYNLGSNGIVNRYMLDPSKHVWSLMNLKQASEATFLVGLMDDKIHIWEQGPEPGFGLHYDRSTVGIDIGEATDATVAPDQKLIATAHPSGYVGLWNAVDRTLVGVIRGVDGPNIFLEWRGTPDNYVLYAASQKGMIYKWSPGKTLEKLLAPRAVEKITAFNMSKDGKTFAITDSKANAQIWNGEKWIEIDGIHGPSALSQDGRSFAVARTSIDVDITELQTGVTTRLHSNLGLDCDADKVYFALNDQRIVSEGCNGVSIWDRQTSAFLANEENVTGLPPRIAAKSTEELWAKYKEGHLNIIDLKSGKKIAVVNGRGSAFEEGIDTDLGGPPTLFAFSESGGLGAAGHQGILAVWRLNSGQAVSYLPYSTAMRRVEFLQDGDALLIVLPSGIPAIVPIDAKGQFKAMCPLFWSEINLKDSRRPAYDFCDSFFKQAHSPVSEASQQPTTWVLDAQGH
jgi:WD40 repeat protein